MARSFSFTLLITSFFIILSCKPSYLLTDYNTKNVEVTGNSNVLDSQLVQMYLPFKNSLEKDMNRVISFSEIEMVKNKPESGLTNLLADLLLIEGRKEATRKNLQIDPEISFFNYGGIRTSLPKGEIKVGNIFELMPFENEMVMLQLSGSQVQQFLNQVAGKGGDSVGGVRFTISDKSAIKVLIDGKSLEAEKKYWLVTNDYVANGGDNLSVFTQRSEMVPIGKKIRDVIISNLEERQNRGEVLTVKLDGRITNE